MSKPKVKIKARIFKLRAGLGREKEHAGQWKVTVNIENESLIWRAPIEYFTVWQEAVDYAVACVYSVGAEY